jgi:hypothetical protein
MKWIQQRGGAIKLRHDQKLVAAREWLKPEHRVTGVRQIMKELAQL